MIKITIIAVGKSKESYWREAEAEYLKRLKPYAKIDIIEIPEEPFKDLGDKDRITTKEAEKIKKYAKSGSTIIALHEKGKEFDSVSLSKFVENQSSQGSPLVFIIGGPLGIHPSIISKAQYQISLSQMTFPHQMVRVILLEQLYRAATISANKQYHY